MGTRIWAVIALVTFATGCKHGEDTITPTVGAITESVYANGLVKSEGQYQVYPTVSGTVLKLLVQEGDTVKAGQPLMRIDDRASSLNTSSADAQRRLLEQNMREDGPVLTRLRAAVDQARDKFALDSINHMRQDALWAKGIGSRNELDQRQLAYTTSKASYQMAAKALTENREQLRTQFEVARNTAAISSTGDADRMPSSLIDGTVYDLMIEPGELATPQKPIAVIGSSSNLYLEMEVDEFDIRQIKPGQHVFVTLDSYGDQAFEAEISRIIPLMNERSRTFRVEARFTKRPPMLYPNLTVEASIVVRTKENALLVPARYVVDGSYVLTAPDEKTLVKLGARDMQNVEILEGITEGTPLYKP